MNARSSCEQRQAAILRAHPSAFCRAGSCRMVDPLFATLALATERSRNGSIAAAGQPNGDHLARLPRSLTSAICSAYVVRLLAARWLTALRANAATVRYNSAE